MNDYVSRQLIYHVDGEEIRIGDDDILTMGRNIVILGEAGMGKTELLKNLEHEGAKFVLARRLTKASVPQSVVGSANCVLIDAVDEVPSYKDGDAIDELVGKLEQAGSPAFILSCRAEDWREATAKSMIEAVYGHTLIEVTLRPFDRDQIITFLSHKLGVEKANEVFDHYHDRGFNDWLGNTWGNLPRPNWIEPWLGTTDHLGEVSTNAAADDTPPLLIHHHRQIHHPQRHRDAIGHNSPDTLLLAKPHRRRTQFAGLPACSFVNASSASRPSRL